MTPLAPLISAFLNQRLPLERRASDHTCEAYAYAFQLLFAYAAERLKVPPCELVREQLEAPGKCQGSCRISHAATASVDPCWRTVCPG
jgi:hypothetical protein